MTILAFPPLESAGEDGLLAVGGDLDVASLSLAYRSGIFPWPVNERLLTWFAPPRRALLFIEQMQISRRLRRTMRTKGVTFAFDRNFPEVINDCAASQNRRGQRGTWITKDIIKAFIAFHRAGHAHSYECYRDQKLVGGLYGVAIGKMFAGESMFYLERDASKLCLCSLAQYLRSRGCEWIDCQVMTPLLKALGAREVPREEFMELLKEAVNSETELFPSAAPSEKPPSI